MTNLIITPVYKAYEIVKEMCEAIDKFSVYPFLHILVDDDSNLNEPFPVVSSEKRRVLMVKRDISGVVHKNGLGQAVQLGYDYAYQAFCNEGCNPKFDFVFLIESDVIVKEQWDKKQIDLIPTLPSDWATLDVQSVDKEGKLTYPTLVSIALKRVNDNLEHQPYADFQCTLFNPEVFKTGFKFSDLVSHFDILWSRKITELTDKKHYRTKSISAMHYGGASRQYLK